MNSVWTQTVRLPRFAPMAEDTKTDVLVVGGGIAGLLCAYQLKQAGVDSILVEAERICSGITKNTTAKLTAQHGLIYRKLAQEFNLTTANQYLRANLEALEQYRTLCKTIDCDIQEQDSFVYSLHKDTALREELDVLSRLGFPASLASDLPLPFSVAGAIRFPRQAQFHPLKFLGAIAAELCIFEQTKVLEYNPECVITNRGNIFAKKVIVATHFPIWNKHGGYFLKMYQHRSYVLALENALNVAGMYVDDEKTGLSFRNYGNLLLLGGGSHRTGKQGGGWNTLTEFARAHFPDAREVARWATQDCMTLDSVPYIGRYSKETPDLYVITGFNKWGMTSAMAGATLLTDLIRGRKNPYESLFSPARTIFRPQLAINAAQSTLHLLTPTVPRCPHMGCALKYNPQEHSWDCPCHGSRFTKTGQLIDNPATDDKHFKNQSL